MLDAETKARIDSARDTLVGKVPDPKSQVEQITIALIYKFMDDMDRQSVEIGGKATFFTREFKKYRWPNLLDKRLSGHERLELYREGIEKMNVNKNIPQLFRDIFKGVFLPYRDPETLNLFLKEINGFIYDHSERLGDAFEYLLSVLGTQGDAGQFRTPRHIIDFIVAVVNPQKQDTVLDPACGTAGFLISAFKHILKKNENLTPDERARLMSNFRGYDIAPDMVCLSRVNLYLHGFPNPVIHEYDTLTSEERWDERCDVIMANPPFMSPKGGIRPHNRFSIKAKRSEVLFVDYIAEHLNPSGRAGVIVPEGIIFQNQNAYKALRKMLIENCLWAVVSLPAGVFNPYAGVKTSVLFLDRNLARRGNDILFIKIESDGFDLGAQRRPNGKSDLPDALRILVDHKEGRKIEDNKKVLSVTCKRLLESTDYNLSGERYKPVAIRVNVKWPMIKFQDICSLEYGESLPERARRPGPFPVVGSNGVTGWHEKASVTGPVIVVGRKGSAGEVNWIDRDCTPIDTTYYIRIKNSEKAYLRFIYYILRGMDLTGLRDGAGVPGLNRHDVYSKEIPIPPLDEQERIVTELEGYRKVIEGARQILASYKPTIRIDPEWPITMLGKVSEVTSSKRILAEEYVPSGTPFYRTKEIVELSKGEEISLELFIAKERFTAIKERFCAPVKGDVLVSAVGTIGVSWVVSDDREFYFKDGNLLWIRNISNLNPFFLKHCLDSTFTGGIDQIVFGAAYKALTIDKLKDFKIPIPPLDVQHNLVAELEEEQKLVEANRELIARMEAKIKSKLAEVWGEEAQCEA
jgi:type I restriction enzyme M protein